MQNSQQNPILERTFEFSLKIIQLYQKLVNEKKEFVLSKQFLKSGTSIGANVTEAQAGQTKKDFVSKMAVASKEARETRYWLLLLIKSGYISTEDHLSAFVIDEIDDIINILTKIVKTGQKNV